jgi:3-hydroxyacyl-[acyl-carrier-protein] dehydratase
MRWYWIDRFLEFESGRYAKAMKNISLAEDYLHDHFPCYPVMPKSLVIEGLAQTGGLLVCEANRFREKVILAKVPRVRFYFEAVPGDTLIYTAVIEAIQENGASVTCTSHRGEELHAEMEVVFVHLNSDYQDKVLFEPKMFRWMMRILRAFEVGHAADGSPLQESSYQFEQAPMSEPTAS